MTPAGAGAMSLAVGVFSIFGRSRPTACLTRSTKSGSGSTGAGGGGGGGSTTFSPDHSRKARQDVQKVSPSGFWLPHFLQTIKAGCFPR